MNSSTSSADSSAVNVRPCFGHLRWVCLAALFTLASGTAGLAQTINASASFQVTGDWGAGANATLWITNTGATPFTNNLLEFDFDHTIGPYNNLRITPRNSNFTSIETLAELRSSFRNSHWHLLS